MESNGKEMVPPVEEGDRLELKCEGIGSKGDGIFKYKGFVIIASNVIKGKTYTLEIKNVRDNVAFAEVVL